PRSTDVLRCRRGVEMNRVIRVFVEVPVYGEGGLHVETRIQPMTFDPAASDEAIGHVIRQAVGLPPREECIPLPACGVEVEGIGWVHHVGGYWYELHYTRVRSRQRSRVDPTCT